MPGEVKSNYHPKAKLAPELYSNGAVEVVDGATQLNYGVWFVFKSNLAKQLGMIFDKNENYFYGASFVTNVFSTMIYSFKFIVANNKNASKIANLIMRIISFGLLVLVSIGAGVLGATLTTMALYASIIIFPLVHALKVFYFFFKCLTTEGEMQQFFYDKMIKNLQIVIFSGILIIALASLFLFSAALLATPFGPPLLMTIGIVGAVSMVGAQIWKLIPIIKEKFIPFIKNFFGFEQKSEMDVEEVEDEKTAMLKASSSKDIVSKLQGITLTPNPALKVRVIAAPESFNYYQYAITPNITDLGAFHDEIKLRQTEIKNNKGNHIWLEQAKLDKKVNALEFLLAFIKEMPKLPVTASKQTPIKIANVAFFYENKKVLTDKIEKHILKTYYNTYESRGKYIGATQAYFRTAFKKFLKGEAPGEEVTKVLPKPLTPEVKRYV